MVPYGQETKVTLTRSPFLRLGLELVGEGQVRLTGLVGTFTVLP